MVNCVRLLPYALIAADRAATVCALDRPQANAFYCRFLDFCGCIWLCYIARMASVLCGAHIHSRSSNRYTHARTNTVALDAAPMRMYFEWCCCMCSWFVRLSACLAAMLSVLLYVHFTLLGSAVCIHIYMFPIVWFFVCFSSSFIWFFFLLLLRFILSFSLAVSFSLSLSVSVFFSLHSCSP